MENKLRDALEAVKPSEMDKKRMYHKIIQERSSEINREGFKMSNRKNIWISGAVAALFMLVFSANYFLKGSNDEVLYSNDGVVVKEAAEIKPDNSGAITMLYTEEDVFGRFDTDAFLGTVLEVKNISLDFDGIVHYRAVAVLHVEKVYDGDLKQGETIQVMLPGPVDTGKVMGADFNITRAMKAGEKGIFLPLKISSDDVWEENGKVLPMKEIAPYTILDTQRFAFIESEEGLLFERDTFPKIEHATSMDEIEEFILEKVKK